MSDTTTTSQIAGEPHFSVEKIYIKDASLESPNAIANFLSAENADHSFTLAYKIKAAKLSGDHYEVVLDMRLAAGDEQNPIFVVEAKQAGIFHIANIKTTKRIDRFLNVRCPRILLPYARETISNLSTKAGLPPLTIGPLDFATPYNDTVAARNAQSSAGQ